MNRGQISQVFLMITTLLVIGGTVFLGGKLIGGLSGTACSANDASFFKEIVQVIEDKASYGSRDIVQIKSPCDAVNLCFVNASNINIEGNPDFYSDNAVIKSVIQSGAPTTIFLEGHDGVTVPVGDENRIEVLSNYQGGTDSVICIPAVSGEFTFRTEGYGRKIRISK